jgi:hypothetical protein
MTPAKGARAQWQHEACRGPCDTAMTPRSDKPVPVERIGEVLSQTRDEGPEVRSFSQAEEVRKPLAAFEESPAHTAPPLTWESSNS